MPTKKAGTLNRARARYASALEQAAKSERNPKSRKLLRESAALYRRP